jgi:uncharacterized membrane protein
MKFLIKILLLIFILLNSCEETFSIDTINSSAKKTNPAKLAPIVKGKETKVEFIKVKAIIQQRCSTCHSVNATEPEYKGKPPEGVLLDTPDQIQEIAEHLRIHVAKDKSMPPGNKTNMTDEERKLIDKWVDQGASIK